MPALTNPPANVLSDAERQLALDEFRAQLEAEHSRRAAELDQKRERQSRREERDEAARHAELFELREQARAEFYATHGYKEYTDSTGRQVWLSPEEYAWRHKRRKHRKEPLLDPSFTNRKITLLFYAAMFVIAVIVGLLLAR